MHSSQTDPVFQPMMPAHCPTCHFPLLTQPGTITSRCNSASPIGVSNIQNETCSHRRTQCACVPVHENTVEQMCTIERATSAGDNVCKLASACIGMNIPPSQWALLSTKEQHAILRKSRQLYDQRIQLQLRSETPPCPVQSDRFQIHSHPTAITFDLPTCIEPRQLPDQNRAESSSVSIPNEQPRSDGGNAKARLKARNICDIV
jgi:hypothetical protein